MKKFAVVLVGCLLLAMALTAIYSNNPARAAVEAAPKAKKADKPALKTMTLDVGKGVKMKLVLVPAGEFMMGSKFTPSEASKRFKGSDAIYTSEHPRHKVTISKPFYVGVFEVTQSQYVAVMGADDPWMVTTKEGKRQAKMVTKIGPDYPASWVHWHEANEFCRKLSKTSGKKVSLPTEAQWEYACRAGTDTAYCYGDDPSKLSEYGWWRGNMVDNDKAKTFARKGGRLKPNAWGLYDMHGNVWEWCSDWFAKDFYAKGKKVDPANAKESGHPNVRGGSWYNDPCHLRSAARNSWCGPKYRHYNYGFRVIVEK